jgi:hypothetical protein
MPKSHEIYLRHAHVNVLHNEIPRLAEQLNGLPQEDGQPEKAPE